MMIRLLSGASLILFISAAPTSAQDLRGLRARLIEDVLCDDRTASGWTELRDNPETATTLIEIASDSSVDVAVRRGAIHFLARLNNPTANAQVQRTVREAMNPSNAYSTAAIAGLSDRSDSVAIGLLRMVLEGELLPET